MPEHWIRFMSSEAGGGLAVVLGAVIRSLLGPGPWRWREFGLSILTGFCFALWIAPWIVAEMQWDDRALGGLCLGFGMTASPISRGIIAVARHWQRNAPSITRWK